MASEFGRLAIRYARALIRAVEREHGTDGIPTPAQQISKILNDFVGVWNSDPQLSLYVLSPVYKRQERLNALVAIAENAGFPPLLVGFLKVLFERDRLVALVEIADSYKKLADKHASVVPVEICTARPISNEEAQRIENQIGSSISGTPEFCWKVDSSLLGGMIVTCEGKVLDGSLSGRLNNLEHTLQY